MKNSFKIRKNLPIGELNNKKNRIKKKFDNTRTYNLMFKYNNKTLDPNNMKVQDIINYTKTHYIESKRLIQIECLVHDLIVFENYRDDLESDIRSKQKLFSFLGALIALFSGTLSIIEFGIKRKPIIQTIPTIPTIPKIPGFPGIPETGGITCTIFLENIRVYASMFIRFLKDNMLLTAIFITFFISFWIYKLVINGRNSKFNKLKTVNQVIRVLINIKECMY